MTLKTLDNSLNLLEYFTDSNPDWGVRELSREMSISHTNVYRILSTFEKHGYLNKNSETGRYELGFKFLKFSTIHQKQYRVSDIVLPIMQKLANDTGESTVITWLEGTEGIYLQIVESSQNIKFAETMGKRAPLYVGASHKVIMAYLPEKIKLGIINKGLPPIRKNKKIDRDELLKSLEKIKEQSWCYSSGEYFEDAAALSVPLFNHNHHVIASITIASPANRLSFEKAMELLARLNESKIEIQNYFSRISIRNPYEVS